MSARIEGVAPYATMTKDELLDDGSDGAKAEVFRRAFNKRVQKNKTDA